MESENKQQELLAKNLVYYRKASGLTQLELAEKFNYSDKSISKWERGEGFPDIFVLKSLADFYGITVDDFYLQEHKQVVVKQSQKRKQMYIKLLSAGIAVLVAFLVFFLINILNSLLEPDLLFPAWLALVYGSLAVSITLLVWNFIYHKRFRRMLTASAVIWTATLSIYLSFLTMLNLNWWLLFVVAIPLEALEIVWYLFRSKKNKTGN